MNKISSRKLVSFSGSCPINCKHCYTFEFAQRKTKSDADEIEDIISGLGDGESFDVIYVSHDRENFIDENAGINLVEALYYTQKKHIFIITRKTLSNTCINRLAQVSEKMKGDGLLLAVAISIPANKSYFITEDTSCIASPEARCDCIRRLHNAGIKTIFLARPLFPDNIIPVDEITRMIIDNTSYIDAVVSSGLAVNPAILKRLQMEDYSFNYLSGNNAEFLIGSEVNNIRYIDVKHELEKIQECCKTCTIPFATHSMQALNILLEKI